MGKESYTLLFIVATCLTLQTASAQSGITDFSTANMASSGALSITISGLDFGTTSYTPTITFSDGNTVCTTTSWTSATTVNCLPDYANYGTGYNLKPTFRGSSTFTNTQDYFTFDAPVVSFGLGSATHGPNGPTTGGSSVTVSGLNFASIDKTATVRVRAACRTSAWTSSTTLSCMTYNVKDASDSRNDVAESVTVTGQAGTFASSFYSFDAPTVSHSTFNLPTSGAGTITLNGMGFAPVNYTPTARVGSTMCQSTSWNTATVVTCVAPAGIGRKISASLTVSAIVGTRTGYVTNFGGISYNTPVVTQNEPANAPGQIVTGAYVTLYGLNFAQVDATPTSHILNNAAIFAQDICTTTSWSTYSTVRCQPNPYGDLNRRNVYLGGIGPNCATSAAGTACEGGTTSTFTYDGPLITGAFMYNGGTSGGNTVTISGLNFGYSDTTPESYVGSGISCSTTSWSSATTVGCHPGTHIPASGGQGRVHVAMTRRQDGASAYFGTMLQGFTFDAPVVSFIGGPKGNSAQSGGVTLSVDGFNFGTVHYSSTAAIGNTHCSTLQWIATTQALCTGVAGNGVKLALTVSVGAIVGTILNSFTFDAPVTTFFNANGPPVAVYSITLAGTGFGMANLSPTVRLGPSLCGSSIWVSDTQIKCATNGGVGGKLSTAVTISAVVGTRTGGFTFDAPVPTSLSPKNTPTSSGASVTLVGMNFGAFDSSTTAQTADVPCETTSWLTYSSLSCKTDGASYGSKVPFILTVGAIVGTRKSAFTYDSPILSAVSSINMPTLKGATVTMNGINFAAKNLTPTAFLEDLEAADLCATTSWTSLSAITCSSPGGSGIAQDTGVTFQSGMAGTQLNIFTYDAPVPTWFGMNVNGPSTGKALITVQGINFAVDVTSSTVRLGSSTCLTVQWSSHTTLTCATPLGSGSKVSSAVSISSVVGTALRRFTFDAPAVTYLKYHNAPTCQHVSISVMGLNFASSSVSSSTRIGTTLCSSEAWVSATSIICGTPVGSGGKHFISVTIASITGTNAVGNGATFSGFTYDAPVLSYILPTNTVTSAGATVSMHGFNFAQSAATPTITVGVTVCATTTWNTYTQVTCSTPALSGSSLTPTITVGALVHCRVSVFTFDSPVLSTAQPNNMPTSAGISITLLGTNFGSTQGTPTARLGGTICGTTAYNSATSILCHMVGPTTYVGSGYNHNNVITLSTTVGTHYLGFTYDAPLLTGLNSYNGATQAAYMAGVTSTPVTFFGLNFGGSTTTETAALGDLPCTTTSWTTYSAVVCGAADSYGGSAMSVPITVSSSIGTYTNAFSFDAPVITAGTPFLRSDVNAKQGSNIMTTSGASVTLFGFNFGGLHSTPSAAIGKTMCTTTTWTSSSSLSCSSMYLGSTSGLNHKIGITIGSQIGTRVNHYTYDSPVLSANQVPWYHGVNTPSSGGTLITVRGINFHQVNTTPTMTVASYVCGTTTWSTRTSLICNVPKQPATLPLSATGQLHKAVGVTISLLVGTANSNWFSFDSPMVSSVIGYNGPTTGALEVTLHGMNFGSSDNTPTLLVGSTIVGTVTWTSTTTVSTVGTQGMGQALNMPVTISSIVSTLANVFTYDAPVITQVDVSNGPASGAATITLLGTDFGYNEMSPSPTATVGVTMCQSTQFISATSIVCDGPIGSNVGHHVSVTIGAVLGSMLTKFSFDAPVMTTTQPFNMATSGGGSLTMLGVNFGGADTTPTAMMGSTGCGTSVWTSSSSVLCTSGSGYGPDVDTGMTISGLLATMLLKFTFDSPSVSQFLYNAPTSSSATLTLRGLNFARADTTNSARVGSTACETTSWFSLTSLLCLHPTGVGTAHRAQVTIAKLAGTGQAIFSYDAPVVTYILQYNTVMSGNSELTVSGNNFAAYDYTATVRLANTVCGTASWLTNTHIMCKAGRGYGQAQAVTAIIQGIGGTRLESFSYDSPVVTYADVFNAPTSGQASITLSGFNFGPVNLGTATVRVGGTQCATSAYVSDTSLICHLPTDPDGGLDANVNLVMTVATVVGTRDSLFSFDSPILSHFGPPPGNDNGGVPNLPTSGGMLTMIGMNFAYQDATPSFRIGTSSCLTTTWSSNTMLTCMTDAGLGTAVSASTFVASLIGTRFMKFTYDAPVTSSIFPKNSASSGGSTVTIGGMNFGSWDYSPTQVLAANVCMTTGWSSLTSLSCTPPTIAGSDVQLTLTIASVLGTLAGSFSYDSPVLSALHAGNTATTAGPNAVISLHGSNFAHTSTTPTVRLGASVCMTSVWTSDTQVRCISQSGMGSGLKVTLTISSTIATLMASFSYDAPGVSHANLWNSPTTGAASVTVMGLNFGAMAATPTVNIGYTVCGTVGWSSSTSLSCKAKVGHYTSGTRVAATISSSVGTLLASFSYDAPATSHMFPANMPNSVGMSVTMIGVSFGKYNLTPSMNVGNTACGTSVWLTDTHIRCHVGSGPVANWQGSGVMKTSSMTISQLVGTLASVFTFDPPAVTHVYHYNLPSSGQTSITLGGFNFGAYIDYTPSARIGSTLCGTTMWTTNTLVKCDLTAGDGAMMQAVMTISTEVGTLMYKFTYDAPVISTFNVQNGPLSGGMSLTISGSNFGPGGLSQSAYIGDTLCARTDWRTDSSVICTMSPGAAVGKGVYITVSGMMGTKEEVFSFDAPILSFMQLYNMPTTAGGQVTVEGTNFGAYDFTPSVRIESTMCSTTSWTSVTSTVCVSDYGTGISRNVGMTMSMIVGTTIGLFSYDSPMVTGLTQANAPTTGGKSMTIQGHNFAVIDTTVTSLIGVCACATTSWTTASVVMCLLGTASAGPDYQVAVTLGGLIGTKQKVFTFDAPVISTQYKVNAPLSGEPSITMIGTNFASQDYSSIGYVGDTVCRTMSWMSVSSAKCFVEAGYAGMHTSTLTIAGIVTTAVESFTYDSPALTYSFPFNSSPAGGVSVTLSGTNFGYSDYSVTVQVAETVCLASKWVSTTSSLCQLAPGVGVGPLHAPSITEHRVAITVGTGVGTRGRAFTFDAPVVTNAPVFNSANTGGKSVTVNGVNFGLSDYSITVGVGRSGCLTTSWSTATALMCAAPAGGGQGHQVSVTVVNIDGTIASLFSYDAPVLSVQHPTNSPNSGGSLLTIHGVGFATTDNSLTVSIGLTQCMSASWTTLSTVKCNTPVAYGAGIEILITVDGLVGTEMTAFTYDSPVVSYTGFQDGGLHKGTNGPITGGASLSISGTNFGETDMTSTAGIAGTDCMTTQWTSGSHVTCVTNTGIGRLNAVILDVAGVLGTQQKVYTFDAPVISMIALTNAAVTDGTRVTVSGSDFGAVSYTPTARVGKTRCATTSWLSATTLSCVVAAGTGNTLMAAVDMFGVIGTYTGVFTYDSPVLSHALNHNGPTSGGAELTMQGMNFAASDNTASLRLADTACTKTRWISSSAIVCTQGQGYGHDHHKAVTVSKQVGTKDGHFTFDGPVLTDLMNNNAPMSGNAMMSIMGLNFAAVDLTVTLTFQSAICSTSAWSSSTTLSCKTLIGYGFAKHVGLTIGSITGTRLSMFSFDSPVLTAAVSPNMPNTGGAMVTVNGLQFLTSDMTPTLSFADMSAMNCLTTSWSTSTSVQCNSGAMIVGTGSLTASITMASTISGTAYLAFTFDGPTMSHSDFVNGPTSGSTFVTVTGLNFGSTDVSNTVKVGGITCLTSSWASATTMYCVTAAAAGVDQSVSAVVSGVSGTLAKAFTFDAPTTSQLATLNSPTTSGASISIFGSDFGTNDYTPSFMLGATVCATVSWTTTTAVNCLAPAGYKSTLTGFLTMQGVIGTHATQTFTFDSPVATFLSMFNAPTAANSGAILSLQGFNFHTAEVSGTVRIGSTICATTSWSSTTLVKCTPDAKVGTGYSAFIVLNAGHTGTRFGMFSYDAPVLTNLVTVMNAPTSGLAQVTFLGLNFGAEDFSGTAVLGETSCASSDWGSDTSIICLSPVGYGVAKDVNVGVAAVLGTKLQSFTYDTAVLTDVAPRNAATTSLASITLTGFNFVKGYDPTPSARIGETGCRTTSWSTESSLTCLSSVGIGMSHLVSATTGGMIGTMVSVFSYDSAVITQIDAFNVPTTSGVQVTISGMNFGVDVLSPTAKIGGLDCSNANKISDTSIVCKQAQGVSMQHSVTTTIANLVGCFSRQFTYDAPVVTFANRFNAATSGKTQLTMEGMNFGPTDMTMVTYVGGTACQSSVWQSDSSMLCQVSAGSGVVKSVVSLVGGLYGTGNNIYSYDSPIVTNVMLANAAGTTSISLTVLGMNFALSDTTVSVIVGVSKCGTVSWTSHSALTCHMSAKGHGVRTFIAAEVGTTATAVGTAVALFTYDAPVVTFVNPFMNSPTSAGVTVTVEGANFGHENISGSAYIGVTSCSKTSYTTGTSATCVVPPGVGQNLHVSMWTKDGMQKGTKLMGFTYDSPAITFVVNTNGPTKAGATVSIEGTNFGNEPGGTYGTDGVGAVVGQSLCVRTDWLSTTAVSCVTPDGTNVQQQIGLIVNGLVGSKTRAFSYDAPILSGLSTPNGPFASDAVTTLLGLNFGNSNESPTVLVGTTLCTTTIWLGDSSVGCRTPSAAGVGISVSLTTASLGAKIDAAFTHDAPAITDFKVANGPTSGTNIVSISGQNFGHTDLSLTAAVSGNLCTATTFVSATSATCAVPAGTGVGNLVGMTIANLVGTGAAAFEYDQPSIQGVTPANGLYIGVTAVTIQGMNFASNAVATVGGTACATTSFVTASQLKCDLPPPSAILSKPQDVAVTVDGRGPSKNFFYVYDQKKAPAPLACNKAVGEAVDIACCTSAATLTSQQPQFNEVFSSDDGEQCAGPFKLYDLEVASYLGHHGDGTFTYNEGCLLPTGKDCTKCGLPVVSRKPYGCYRANSFPDQLWFINVNGPDVLPKITYDPPTAVATQVSGTVPRDMTTPAVTVVRMTNTTDYHKYKVSGVLTLAGKLHLQVASGFTPLRTTCFEIFDATSVTGTFSEITVGSDTLVNATTEVCSATPVWSVKITTPGCETLYSTCSGHGTCTSSTGLCACTEGYSGAACDAACWYNITAAAYDCTCAADLGALG